MQTIGIDPGLNDIGAAILDDGKLLADVHLKSEGTREAERIYKMVSGIMSFLRHHGVSRSSLLALEGYAYAGHRVAQFAELGGHLRVLLWQIKMPLIIVPPNTLKKFVTGDGRAKQPQMAQSVRRHWAYDPAGENEHLIAAYALAQFAHAYRLPSLDKWLVYQKEVIEVYKKKEASKDTS